MRNVIIMLLALTLFAGCSGDATVADDNGVKQVKAEVATNSAGITVEQQNISDRLEEDNKPGAIKHLYVISAYSGQTIIYSTVRGKVTSGGKRLTPTLTCGPSGDYADGSEVLWASMHGRKILTSEVLQDDGTYGTSAEYLYWWDTKGIYHQHYVSGGQIVHISSEPLAVKSIIINMEQR
jgi:uncharacterized protein YcfL